MTLKAAIVELQAIHKKPAARDPPSRASTSERKAERGGQTGEKENLVRVRARAAPETKQGGWGEDEATREGTFYISIRFLGRPLGLEACCKSQRGDGRAQPRIRPEGCSVPHAVADPLDLDLGHTEEASDDRTGATISTINPT